MRLRERRRRGAPLPATGCDATAGDAVTRQEAARIATAGDPASGTAAPETAAPGAVEPGAATHREVAALRKLALPGAALALVERIGGTPLLPLPSPKAEVRLFGKAEWFNPGGSVKDRPAWAIVRDGLERGKIGIRRSEGGKVSGHSPDGDLAERRLLDASSGNTAIAYAMLGAAAGFGVTLCVPANASPERVRTLRAYGAELILTDPLEGSDGAIVRARELAAARPELYWYADQYGNPENWRAHYRTTAEEIWRQTGGEITHFVAGLGTTGTLIGTARRLRELRPDLVVGALQPGGRLHGIEGLKHLDSSIRPTIYDDAVPDLQLRVETEEAQEAARGLAREAGLLVGTSSGAAWAACRRLAERLDGGVVVTVLPDGGGRYLSDNWWEE